MITVRKSSRLLVALAAGAALFTAAPAAQADTTPSDQCSAAFHQGDFRLGPEQLPSTGPVGRQLLGYRRTGGASVPDFLAKYYDSAAGSWKYPPQNGYLLGFNSQPIEFDQPLPAGQDIDRYGSEYGSFLAPEGTPYPMRAIPPQSLDSTPAAGCNYHDYKVLKSFTVHGGPIAPWFNQPGLGWQYQLDATLIPGAPAQINVGWLVTNGYLQRLV
ncbi:TNT domain-containing protein [Kitasatospora sp. NBC_01287]|uniref:TNT domain-containing protein n=1 Tax=Kitasatospora sp. NBC_01287 TaxID=2903573 RepID=UPI00225336F2|nr:TNT domain-containing protein [Kitasatospora sp. NBC_01287]MCX4747450.1 TNT domain-containing protein [Kitasatospora sp. NBC_01287]